jgi:argininosuccinate synthase
VQSNLLYENVYLLGTALARPVICKRQIEIAIREGCEFVSHGCTGKGNDQVRFELGYHHKLIVSYYALHPSIQVVAPWRDPAFFNRFPGRSKHIFLDLDALLKYAAEKEIAVFQTAAKPWSTGLNLFL